MDLREILCYELDPIPWAIAGVDGTLVITAKSSLLEVSESYLLQKNFHMHAAWVIDGMAVLQSFTSVPDMFANLAAAVFRVFTASFF